jgi:phosphocarrier protein HPr
LTVSKEILVANKRGLHARASAKFVTMVATLNGGVAVEVEKDGNKVTGSSIMGLMMLGAAMGDTIVIHCDGEGADAALAQLSELVESKFGEE